MTRRRLLIVAASLGILLAGLCARLSSAAFTASTAIGANTLTADKLGNYFSVAPASSYASGNVDTLALAFGTVPSARTFTSVFTVTNVSGAPRTATLTLAGVAQVTSVVFASSGTTSATLASGASTTVSVTTSATIAGHGAGTLELRLGGSTWLYRTYNLTLDEAPESPAGPSAVAVSAGRIQLGWTASTTTTNLAGYDIYRSSGGAYTKLNVTPLPGTTYTDAATVDGTAYSYKVDAVSSGSPTLSSLDSTVVSATADATAPTAPTAVTLNGTYVNIANKASVSVTVTLAAGSLSSDRVTVTLTGGATASGTVLASPGAGTVAVTGIDASALTDGTITVSATSTDAAGNVSGTRTATNTKDTVAPAQPTAAYTDATGAAADSITGTAEASATVKVSETTPVVASFQATASATGAYTATVAAINGTTGHPIAYSFTVWAVDAAGNAGPTRVVAGNDTK